MDPSGMSGRAERDRRYNLSDKGRARHQRYKRSDKGKETKQRENWNRHIRNLKAERPLVEAQLEATEREAAALVQEIRRLSPIVT